MCVRSAARSRGHISRSGGVAAPEVYGDPASCSISTRSLRSRPRPAPATQILHIANLNDGEAPKMPGTVTMAPTSPAG